jgi:porphobilinogen synthase
MNFPKTRLRRLRQSANIRALVKEHTLCLSDLIYPIFVVPGTEIYHELAAMPGQFQYSLDQLPRVIEQVRTAQIPAVLLFGQTQEKDPQGCSAADPTGVIPQALALFKKALPDLCLITDVCLCSYTDHGHCGPLRTSELGAEVDNDATLAVLVQTAIAHAKAGAHFVAPSGMMDGMVAALREDLDQAGFTAVGIMAYSVKYASSFYGPFREAADSTPHQGDRTSYQMNPANLREALREATLDVAEGADFLMVKPGLAYLDVLNQLHQHFDVPVVAYQVSGEYSMIKAAAEKGWLDEKKVALETLIAFKRAGASAIITYFALDAAAWIKSSTVSSQR